MSNQVKISNELVEHFVKWSAGYLSSKQLDTLIKSFEKEFSKFYHSRNEESNLIRIISSIIDKGAFLVDCYKYPHHAEILCSIASCSIYLTDILVRNPELLYQLFNDYYLKSKLSPEILSAELNNGFNLFKNNRTKIRFLKSIKRKYILKIGVNDILGRIDIKTTTEQISMLASNINSFLFNLSYDTVLKNHGINSTKRKYCLISLGKLGGNELNYSSDIDLMVIIDKDGTVGKKKGTYYSDLITETINQYVAWATEFSDLGNLYRVDFRLRPDGNMAPLTLSLLDTINYYESRGEQWEKQMLIKVGFVGGNKELFNQFQKFVNSYVYNSNFIHSPLKAIAKMKLNIEKQYSDKKNVKTTIGGIRDIEFSIQALQILYAGKNKELRNGNSLECLKLLFVNNLINELEYKTLSEAYIFYRKIEHFLQLMNNTQTHTLPKDEAQLIVLSKYMQLNSIDKFEKKLSKFQRDVRKIFNSIVSPEVKASVTADTSEDINFKNASRAEKNLEFLEYGTGLISKKMFDSTTTERFNEIKPILYSYLNDSNHPDLVVENFAKVVGAYKLPSVLYKELSNKKILTQFLRILEYSALSISLILEHPPLIENLISKKIFHKDFSTIIKESNYKELLFILTCQYTIGLLDESKVSYWLSKYIENKIRVTFEKLNIKESVFIAGLGSFALYDINFKSDIDLIVVADNIDTYSGLDEVFQKFISMLQKELMPIEIDFRLRPEGKSSPLVWDVNNYAKYLQSRAEIWEFQSLIKSNYICGDETTFKSFNSIVKNTLSKKPNFVLKSSILEMHQKSTQQKLSKFSSSIDIKKSPGSFITVDYLLTLILLQRKKREDIFIGGQLKTKLIQDTFKGNKIIFENYIFLKRLLFALQITANWNKSKLPTDNAIIDLTCNFIGNLKPSELSEKLNAIFSYNYKIFNEMIEKID